MIENKTIVIILLQSTVFFTSPIKPWRCAADVFGAVIVAKPDFIFEQLQTTQLCISEPPKQMLKNITYQML